MPSVPSPRSFQQIVKTMRQTFISLSGVNDVAPGSSMNSFIEAAALSDLRSQGDIFAALNSVDIDRAEGVDLDNLGTAKGVPRPQSNAASGNVTLGSSNFSKIATKIYAGTAAPPIGSVSINVSDASAMPQQGAVYIGRGSNNIEGPIPYTSITRVGNFFQINLSTPTTKNHNVNETVILAQGGNRVVNVGTIVQTPANTTSPSVTYRLLTTVTVPDGEDSLTDVPVVCTQLGTVGNASSGAISTFANSPYPGATVTNPVGFINGADVLSDVDYRLLIKNTEQTKTKGTDLAIETAAVGVTSTDDNQTVTSASIQSPAQRGEPGILYIDNGLAYQPIFSGQGFEQVVDDANGGEKFLQLQQEDITKALLVSSFSTPFVLTGGMKLAVEVGGVLSEHIFADGDFATQNAAETFEVVNSINADTSLLFSARSADNSQNVVIFAKNFVNEDLQVVVPSSPGDIDANSALGFDSNLTYTLRLYKNDILLIKDGRTPSIPSLVQTSWAAMSSGETLTIQVDQSIYITYTFVDADFIPYGFQSLSNANSLASWASVFNAKIAGITASVNGSQLVINSNKGPNNNAALNINSSGSSLASKMFGFSSGILSSQGLASDYALNRSTGQIQLAVVLNPGDVVTAGSKNTRGFEDSASVSTGSISLNPATGTTAGPIIWVSLDSPAVAIPTTAGASSQITITNPASNRWRFTSSVSAAFTDVLPGDWVILSDDAIFALNPNFIGAWRVSAASTNYIEFYMTQSLGSTGGPFSLQGSHKISFVRTNGSMQQLNLLTGVQTLTAIATGINTQLKGGLASAVGGKILRITTNTFALGGEVIIAGFTTAADSLGFVLGSVDSSTVTHTAFAQALNSELTIPSFIFDSIATGDSSIPPTSITTSSNLQTLGVNPDQLLSFLDPYIHESSNRGLYTQIASLSGTSVVLRPNSKMRDIIANDRYFAAVPYDFDALDNLVVILDNDSVNKSLNIPLGRNGTVSNAQVPTSTQFRAYDSDAGPTANYPNQFGNNFDFKDFKIHFYARQLLDPAGPNNKIVIRSVKLGPTGQSTRFGIDYPTAPNSPMTYSIASRRFTDIKVYLASGPERLGGAWDATSQFDVTTTASNVWRYTWNGTGTSPNFVGGAAVAVGDVVSIAFTSDFSADNTGTFQVSTVTNTYFEVTNFYGLIENNIQLDGASSLRFWPLVSASNTASQLQTYVTANLADYVTVAQLQSGAGVITTSTYDDSGGTSQYVQLTDGENWISLSNIGTTISPQNQFNLKVPFNISSSDPDYSIVGEKFAMIPTTADQVVRFLNIFAVTGLSSLGNLVASNDAGQVEIYSNQFGSAGSVLVSGGSANSSNGAIIVSGEVLLQDDISTIGRNGSTVTVITSDKHDVQVGDLVIISDVNNPTFDGRFTVTATTAHTFQFSQTVVDPVIAAPTTGAARSSNVVTITTTTAHNLAIGDTVTIASVTDASFDGTFPVVSVPSSTTFTYNQVGVDGTSGNGSVTNVQSAGGEVLRPYTEVSINRANRAGLQSGQWLKISNTATQAKIIGFDQTTNLSITSFNTLNITSGSGSFQTARTTSADNTTQVRLEKQAQFICISWTGTGTAPNFVGGGVQEGDWVKISGAFQAVNQGIYKVAKLFSSNAIYIENSNAIEENITLSSANDLSFYSYDSVMPGDQLLIESNVLGTSNQGTYTVAASPFPTSTSLVVSSPAFIANQSPTALGVSFAQIVIKESAPFYEYKQLLNISRDPANINGYNLVLNGDTLAGKISVSAGAGIAALSKFSFPTTVQSGEDSYKYYGGLIHAVGQVIRGEATDPVQFPGVAASGSYIEISSPLPKEIQISIVIRNRTGVPFQTIKSRVQSAVAAYVNSLGVGQPVVFSEIITAVQAINGIQAVSIASPTYNSTNDQIISQFNEKPIITNVITDVIVSLAS